MKELIISKLKNSVNDFLNIKMYNIYSLLDNLYIKMIQIISKISGVEDNLNINNIIKNYQIILSNQNNQFIFKFSNIPFEYLYSFIKDILEPPILEIKIKYNLIEEQILEKVLVITNNIPDYREAFKETLQIEDIFSSIEYIISEIKDSLLKYQDALYEDYNSYINKLIHYTYINGLKTYYKPCNYSFCSIDIDEIKENLNLRSLNEKNNTENKKIKFKKKKNIKIIEKNNNINKNIDLRFLENSAFDETMGSLSKDDIKSILNDINYTIYELNENYTNNMEKIGIKKVNNYISKLNGTNKLKLKRAILNSLSPFSPILSKEAFNNLKDNMLIQYNNLENYIINYTNNLHDSLNDLNLKLIKTSDYLYSVNNIGYEKIVGYYNMFNEIIESKYRLIENEEEDDKDDDDGDIEGPNEIDSEIFETNDFKKIKDDNSKFIKSTLEIVTKFEIELKGSLIDLFKGKNQNNNDEEEDDDDDDISAELTLGLGKNGFKQIGFQVSKKIELLELVIPIPPIIVWFTPFPYLQIRIAPLCIFGLYFEMGTEMQILNNEYSIFFDVYGSAEVSLSLELGFYIPPFNSKGVEVSLSIGIKGILGSGKVGIKLSIYINKPKIETEVYILFKSMEFTFFILFKVKIDIGIIKFSFQFYLINQLLCDGIGFTKKKTRKYELPKIRDLALKFS